MGYYCNFVHVACSHVFALLEEKSQYLEVDVIVEREEGGGQKMSKVQAGTGNGENNAETC